MFGAPGIVIASASRGFPACPPRIAYVMLLFNQFVSESMLGVGTTGQHAGNAIDNIGDQVKTIEVVQNNRAEGRALGFRMKLNALEIP